MRGFRRLLIYKPEDVEQITVDTGNKGKMKITQFMGRDKALPQVEGFSENFDFRTVIADRRTQPRW
jgi:hypothetical protein